MHIPIEKLKELNIFNTFYKIKCTAIFLPDDEENFVMTLLCTVHNEHYFIVIDEMVTIEKVDNYTDMFKCFNNDYNIEGHIINEEFTLIKDENIFNCNFFTIFEYTVLSYKMLSIAKKIDFSRYQLKSLTSIVKNIYKEDMPIVY